MRQRDREGRAEVEHRQQQGGYCAANERAGNVAGRPDRDAQEEHARRQEGEPLGDGAAKPGAGVAASGTSPGAVVSYAMVLASGGGTGGPTVTDSADHSQGDRPPQQCPDADDGEIAADDRPQAQLADPVRRQKLAHRLHDVWQVLQGTKSPPIMARIRIRSKPIR